MIKPNSLIFGDCLEVMKSIEDKSFDLIVSDPPYPDYYQEDFSYNDDLIYIFDKYSCRQFIFWSAKVDFPLDYTARHIWDKITGAACQYDFKYERNGHKRQKVFRGHRINSTVSAKFAKEKFYNHKSQKPLNVIEDIINYSKIDGIVVDPFIGSGTTAIAAINTNRKWIGIEKDRKIFEIAKNRIREHLNDSKITN